MPPSVEVNLFTVDWLKALNRKCTDLKQLDSKRKKKLRKKCSDFLQD